MRTLLHMWNTTARQHDIVDWSPRPEAAMDGKTQANQHIIVLPGRRHSFGEWSYDADWWCDTEAPETWEVKK